MVDYVWESNPATIQSIRGLRLRLKGVARIELLSDNTRIQMQDWGIKIRLVFCNLYRWKGPNRNIAFISQPIPCGVK